MASYKFLKKKKYQHYVYMEKFAKTRLHPAIWQERSKEFGTLAYECWPKTAYIHL